MANRLANASSPYLLQHAANPVDWWEWGPEAFAEAKRRDTPVLLSVGYAACHWCHVMAHESFSDAETARLMNEHFVSIKVDREERPDVDAVYMAVTQALTGQGGWPMTVFCGPDGEPFYAGTYFPPEPRPGMPSFRQVLAAVAVGWRDDRARVVEAGDAVVARLTELSGGPASGAASPAEVVDGAALDLAVGKLSAQFDVVNAGFGDAPKFPAPLVLEFLLRAHARSADPSALTMVERTVEAMSRGGMYDQLAGGFARYAVDDSWTVPHFEKMLYDNALLLRLYARFVRSAPHSPTARLARRVAHETASFLTGELGLDRGGFAASLDADTDGREGAAYVWTAQQLSDALGEPDGSWVAQLCEVTEQGTFEDGASVLQLRADPGGPDGSARWAAAREKLRAARESRAQPARDDKVVAAWNGLAIAALAEAGMLLEEPRYVRSAVRAAEYLHEVHWIDGRLRRSSRDGRASSAAGVLEDYADLAEGLLTLVQATGDARWLQWAGELLEVALTRFGDGGEGWFDTADDAERLVVRPRDPADNATPSGASALAGACLTYAALTGSARHRQAAERTVNALLALIVRAPRFAGWLGAVAEALLAGPAEVAVVGSDDDPARAALVRAARLSPAPGAVVVAGDAGASGAGESGAGGEAAGLASVGAPGSGPAGVPLLADRPLVDDRAAAYVCRGFVCQSPVTDPGAVAALMSGTVR